MPVGFPTVCRAGVGPIAAARGMVRALLSLNRPMSLRPPAAKQIPFGANLGRLCSGSFAWPCVSVPRRRLRLVAFPLVSSPGRSLGSFDRGGFFPLGSLPLAPVSSGSRPSLPRRDAGRSGGQPDPRKLPLRLRRQRAKRRIGQRATSAKMVQEAHHVGRQRRAKRGASTLYRMLEFEQLGVEGDPSQQRRRVAVPLVSDQRMPHVGEVDPDLVLAASLQLDAAERRAVESLEHGPVSDGRFSFIRIDPDAPRGGMSCEPRAFGPRRGLDLSFSDGKVEPPGGVRFELRNEPPQRLERPREHEKAGDLAVQPVDGVELGFLQAPGCKRLEETFGERRGFQVRCGNREKPRVLVRDDHVPILVDDAVSLARSGTGARAVVRVGIVKKDHSGASGQRLGMVLGRSPPDLDAAAGADGALGAGVSYWR